MIEPEDLDLLAAEYALGTLDAAERTAVAARLPREPALAAAVAAWERRLAPLAESVPPEPPPPDLFARIEARLAPAAPRPPGEAGDGRVVDLTRRLRRWRLAAGLATSLAASLAVFVGYREASRPPAAGGPLVAVLQEGAAQPAFLLAVDPGARTFTLRRVAAPPQPGRAYELWLVSDRLPAPRSLGLAGAPAATGLAGLDPAAVAAATFAISLEPEGGSPTGAPTGRVVYSGKLVPMAP